MNRIKYEQYHGAAGYDAVARKKIKELEEKVGTGGGSGRGIFEVGLEWDDSGKPYSNKTLDEIITAFENGMTPVLRYEGKVYNLLYNLDPYIGADFVAIEANLNYSETYIYLMRIYPSGRVRKGCLLIGCEVDDDTGDPEEPSPT